jgi:hypothetical protein
MNTIKTGAMVRALTSSTRFDSLTFSKNGLLLKYRNKQEIEIPFADLCQIYIKKHKLNPFMEFIGISFPFLFVFMSIQYLPFNIMIFVSIISIILVFMSIVNYKWYVLYVHLNDGTTFRKKISSNLKSENISTIEKVRTEYLYFNASAMTMITT